MQYNRMIGTFSPLMKSTVCWGKEKILFGFDFGVCRICDLEVGTDVDRFVVGGKFPELLF